MKKTEMKMEKRSRSRTSCKSTGRCSSVLVGERHWSRTLTILKTATSRQKQERRGGQRRRRRRMRRRRTRRKTRRRGRRCRRRSWAGLAGLGR